jgi:hypothetical protein
MKKQLPDISFVKHPRDNGMNYFQHMGFALMLARRTFITSLASIVHAFFPFLLETYTSSSITELNKIFEKRKLNNNFYGDIDRKKTRHSGIFTEA